MLALSGFAQGATLNDLYQQGVNNSLVLKSAKSGYESDQEQETQGFAALLPNATLTGVWGDQREKNVLSGNNLFTPVTNPTDQTSSLGYELRLTQTLFNMTAYRQFEASSFATDRAKLTLRRTYLDFTVEYFTAYLNVVMAWQRIKNVNEALTSYENQKESITKRFNVGLARPSDLQQAESALAIVKADKILAENDLGLAFRNLELIVQQDVPKVHHLTDHLQNQSLVEGSLADNLQSFADNNEYQISVTDLKIAQKEVDVANSRRYPTVTANVAYYDNHFDQTFNYQRENEIRQDGLSFSLQIQVPLYRGGRASSLSQQAGYNVQSARYLKQFSQQQIQQSIRAAYLNMEALLASINARKDSIEATKTALANAQDEYMVGIGQYTDVLNSQARLYEERNRVITERINYLNNYIQFVRLTGKLNDSTLEKLEGLFAGETITNKSNS